MDGERPTGFNFRVFKGNFSPHTPKTPTPSGTIKWTEMNPKETKCTLTLTRIELQNVGWVHNGGLTDSGLTIAHLKHSTGELLEKGSDLC